MRNQTKESRRLKDLIRIGVFSALWVVIGFLVAFTIGFFPPILLVLPCVLGIIGGIVYVVMLSKLTIPGGISAGYLPVYDGPLWHDVLLHCGWRCDRRNPL